MAALAAIEMDTDTDNPIKASKASKISRTSQLLKKPKSADAKIDVNKPETKPISKKTVEAKSSDENSIPLLCCVCPSHPRFSDVSHLLTHLSSKGHLHTLNTTRLSSLADLSAAETIATYDKWYAQNNLHQMLAERLLAAKDGKEKGRRVSLVLSQSQKRKKTLLSRTNAGTDGGHSWTSSRVKNEPGLQHQQAITFYGDSSRSPAMDSLGNIQDWAEDGADFVRLKGIIWPGMSLFDSATPEQKKKRNQRKDASVLQQMMLDSQSVTSTELVSNLRFEVERTRDVYDAPSVEGSPLAKKPRGRKRRSHTGVDNGNGSPEVLVKAEPESDEEPAKPAARGKRMHFKNEIQMNKHTLKLSPSPGADIEFNAEKLEVASDVGNVTMTEDPLRLNLNVVSEQSHIGNGFDAELDDSSFGEDPSNFTTNHSFTIPEEPDVFPDGIPTAQAFQRDFLDEARFDIRNRIPLQPMNSNSNMSLASSTPAAKQPSQRFIRGKENNHGLQEQGLGNRNFHTSDPNIRLSQTRMPSMGTTNPFNNYQQQQTPDMVYHPNSQFSWLPPVSRAPTNAFHPINGNPNHHLFFGNQLLSMAVNAYNNNNNNENDQGQSSGMFNEGV
ncbi:uncharacterized protein CTRU02_205305 [Colletotrichum truncatum]|uniref:Uncharacterized protein n=1 Tax=Colletotrichum truncatum TaxID=5467 RepID=A0ACC3Z3N2_COLTU